MEPIWIDLQINGYAGVDFNSPGLTVDAVKEVVRRLAADGTAGFCPTFVTGDPEVVVPNIRTIVAARKADAECARRILGLHLEGPFISSELGAVGSHPIEWVTTPSLEKFARYQDAAEGLVRLITVAAEIPEMPEFVRAVSRQGVVVSLGHQMAATPAEVEPCLAAGARAFTHLGNGIPNMISRHDNVIFTALAEDRAQVMFILVGRHLPDTVLGGLAELPIGGALGKVVGFFPAKDAEFVLEFVLAGEEGFFACHNCLSFKVLLAAFRHI